MTVAQRRVLRGAAGADVRPARVLVPGSPGPVPGAYVPCGGRVGSRRLGVCLRRGEGQIARIVAGGALALLPLALLVAAWLWWWD